nr:hypothetical protein [uncultured Albidiferax sp.]
MTFADWAPYTRPMARNIAITSSEITLDFPAGRYLVDPPVVLVTVSGGPTDVTITTTPEAVAGLGEVYARVQLTFPPSAVGLRAHVWIAGA